MVTTILRLPAVKFRTGLSRSTIYLRISKGDFPAPISLGDRAVGWIEAEINDWLTKHIEASRKSVKEAHIVDPIVKTVIHLILSPFYFFFHAVD